MIMIKERRGSFFQSLSCDRRSSPGRRDEEFLRPLTVPQAARSLTAKEAGASKLAVNMCTVRWPNLRHHVPGFLFS